MKSQLDSAGGRICTIGNAITYSLLPQSFGAMSESIDPDDEKMPSSIPRRTSTVVLETAGCACCPFSFATWRLTP